MSRLTSGRIEDFLLELKSDGTIFRVGDEQLFRHFCRYFLGHQDGLSSQYRAFRDALDDAPSMWTLARDLLEARGDEVSPALHRMAIGLLQRKIARTEAVSLLRAIGSLDVPDVDRAEFWTRINEQ